MVIMDAMNHKPRPPQGYTIIKRGEMLPDDLIWSWTTKEWVRADDPVWVHKVPVDMCVAVCRKHEPKIVKVLSQREQAKKDVPW